MRNAADVTASLFAGVPHSAAEDFKLWFYAAIVHVIGAAVSRVGSWEPLFERFPFLAHYNNELSEAGIGGVETSEAPQRWLDDLVEWEAGADGHLPLRALREVAALAPETLALLMTIGLPDDDPRFGPVFDALQGDMGHKRPTAGLIGAWWDAGDTPPRAQLRQLHDLGLVQPLNADAPRSEWSFEVPAALWDAARGDQHPQPAAAMRFRPIDELPGARDLVTTAALAQSIDRLPGLVRSGDCDAIIVRGPHHNGRGTVAGAVARALGRGVLELHLLPRADDARWRTFGALATLLHAMPMLRLDVTPGEAADVPSLRASDAPLAVVLGRQGGVTGAGVARAIALSVDPPDPAARARHWKTACGDAPIERAEIIADRFRLTSGNIHRAARIARSRAALDGRQAIAPADVQEAARTLNREALDMLATRVSGGRWSHLALSPQTRRELSDLERRCRVRERLGAAVGPALAPQLSCGVRALLSGLSGLGKSMVARALASVLQMDLYVVNIAAILNKYVGETEKNLHTLFSRAEELDVMLLLDEGDALLTARTAVASANDRYANFETNFLLQRIESFDGILLITSNAAERIDSAFQRRLDVVIEFTPPEPPERLAIWDVHLPSGHAVDYDTLAEIASRCVMTGGQIRNAVLHASALAVETRDRVTSAHVRAAVEREYRKAGAICPLGAAVHA